MSKFRTARAVAFPVFLIAFFAAGVFAQVSTGGRGPVYGPSYQVAINSNIRGATVYLNGSPSGQTPYRASLAAGSYSVLVRLAGYQDYSTTIQVSGPLTINAYLTSMSYNLSIVSNVNGAQVIVNGQSSGQTPTTLSAQPGVYDVQVVANGYQPFSTRVTVSQDTTINAQLIANMATLRFVLPNSFFNPDWDRSRAVGQIGIWVDGRQVGQGDVQVTAGTHTVRFGSGGWSVQSSYYFTAGQLYVLSPQLSIAINPTN